MDPNAHLLSVSSITFVASKSVAILEVTVPFHFQVGDHLVLYPRNNPKVVEMVAKHLSISLDKTFKISSIKETDVSDSTKRIKSSGKILSVAYLLSDILDLNASPSQSFLDAMGKLMTEESDRRKLEKMKEERNGFRTIADVIVECKSLNISIPLLMEIVPKIKPRFYSIASSPLQNSSRVTLAGTNESSIKSSIQFLYETTKSFHKETELNF